MTGRQTGRHTIIHDHAVFPEHKSVSATPRLQVIPVVGVQQIEKTNRIWATNINLAEGRCVQHPDAVSCGETFAVDRCGHILTFAGIKPGALPLPHVLKTRTSAYMPSVDRCLSDWIKKLFTKRSPRHRTEGHWRIVGAKGSRSHLTWRFAQGLGQNRQSVDVAKFALISAETERGVTLDVLD